MTRQKKDILQESWVYWEIAQEFYEEGFKQGYEEVVKERRQKWVQALQELIMAFVQAHFLELVVLARHQVDTITDPDVLQKLLVQVVATRSVEEVRHVLVEGVMIEPSRNEVELLPSPRTRSFRRGA